MSRRGILVRRVVPWKFTLTVIMVSSPAEAMTTVKVSVKSRVSTVKFEYGQNADE